MAPTLTTLPAEIRNHIFALTLLENSICVDGSNLLLIDFTRPIEVPENPLESQREANRAFRQRMQAALHQPAITRVC
jgi:hypothetical protein